MKKSNKNIFVVVLVVVIAVGLLGSGNLFLQTPETQSAGINAKDVLQTKVPCINPSLPLPQEYHIHPHLQVLIVGQNVEIPKDVGIGVGGCERALHTHDTTGEIHIEPNFYQEFTLRDFFTVWGLQFSRDQISTYKRDADHDIVMTVDGKPNQEFENLILRDKQQIVVEHKKK